MICCVGLKSGKGLLIETDYSLLELCEAKRDCIKSMIFKHITYCDNIRFDNEILVDLYSIETMEEIKENKKGEKLNGRLE